MTNDPVKFDENGNFIFDAELEKQWTKLHREIQREYWAEQGQALLLSVIGICGSVAVAYLVVTGFRSFSG